MRARHRAVMERIGRRAGLIFAHFSDHFGLDLLLDALKMARDVMIDS